jgi:hypothetical protein
MIPILPTYTKSGLNTPFFKRTTEAREFAESRIRGDKKGYRCGFDIGAIQKILLLTTIHLYSSAFICV